MAKLSLIQEIDQEQLRLTEWKKRPVKSVCRQYILCHRGDPIESRIKSVDGDSFVEWVCWENYPTAGRSGCKVGLSNGDEAVFSWPTRPSWLARRWVQCFGPSIKTICHRLRREGVVIVDAYKPGLCVWNTLHLRGDRSVIDKVLDEIGQKWSNKQPRGAW